MILEAKMGELFGRRVAVVVLTVLVAPGYAQESVSWQDHGNGRIRMCRHRLRSGSLGVTPDPA